jgi:hypothetical protein
VLGSAKQAILSLVCTIHGDEKVTRMVLVLSGAPFALLPELEISSLYIVLSLFSHLTPAVHSWQSEYWAQLSWPVPQVLRQNQLQGFTRDN